jgi:hypothetical protein
MKGLERQRPYQAPSSATNLHGQVCLLTAITHGEVPSTDPLVML